MQYEVLQFLIEAHRHLRGSSEVRAADLPSEDLQAVERHLPDCDWFAAEEIWAGRASAFATTRDTPNLEF